ncbi:hypothetical protein [Sphingomonas yantingensis]|uniref:Uncharacterized protein n=1 Tax=Sphingomonas yantingensis TaxID=1241761 RepID=A0A7W9APR9_9SPHN|nr:hypothetical protein [Sphingomonas yantingensis]MBB5698141.1 hypothetical protein [Sphingomonas yantingensis]
MRSNTTSSTSRVWPPEPIDVKATVALPLVTAMSLIAICVQAACVPIACDRLRRRLGRI